MQAKVCGEWMVVHWGRRACEAAGGWAGQAEQLAQPPARNRVPCNIAPAGCDSRWSLLPLVLVVVYQLRRQLQWLGSLLLLALRLAAQNLCDEGRGQDDASAGKALCAQPLTQHDPGKGCKGEDGGRGGR